MVSVQRIKAAVGPHQPNKPDDVSLVQMYLGVHERWLDGQPSPSVNGQWNDETKAAIIAFQKNAAALKKPDGIVGPHGYTMTALTKPVILPPSHQVFSTTGWHHPNDQLTDADFQNAAMQLGCEVAAIRSVAQVEVGRQGAWDAQGRPTILFERHKFAHHTHGSYNHTHPDISNPTPGGYGLDRAQYERLRRAAMLNEQAALKSASWGMFQIMGENHVAAGYSNITAFVNAMLQSRSAHLSAFVSFVKSNRNLKVAIQKKDWTAFARGYNGPKYAENQYDTKLLIAYQSFSAGASPSGQQTAGARR